jgi:hypothetical protein
MSTSSNPYMKEYEKRELIRELRLEMPMYFRLKRIQSILKEINTMKENTHQPYTNQSLYSERDGRFLIELADYIKKYMQGPIEYNLTVDKENGFWLNAGFKIEWAGEWFYVVKKIYLEELNILFNTTDVTREFWAKHLCEWAAEQLGRAAFLKEESDE